MMKIIINTLFFILGFTIIFVILGIGAVSLSVFLALHKGLIATVGGAIIIVLSLHIMGAFNIPFLNYERRVRVLNKPRGIFGALIIGITFAAAWTPCFGPILSSILILAATKDTAATGVKLLFTYSLGLGLPFIFSVAAYGYFVSLSKFVKKNYRIVRLVSGILLLAIGLVLVFGQFQKLYQFISFIPDFSLIEANHLSMLVAAFAGFVSFISPCVLPLIPSYLTFITGVSVLELKKYGAN